MGHLRGRWSLSAAVALACWIVAGTGVAGEARVPEGTVLTYDTWSCKVTDSSELKYQCRDPEHGNIGFYGLFEPVGSFNESPSFKALVPLMSYDIGYDSDVALKVRGFTLDKKARQAIEGLWPLEVGKTTKYKIKYDARGPYGGQVLVRAKTEVKGRESLTVAGVPVETFIISQEVNRRVIKTRGEPGADDVYGRTVWLDAERGFIVKERREWLTGYRKGKTAEYTLESIELPEAPAIAQSVPRPSAAPAAQTAVSAAVDKRGPAIDIPTQIEATKPVVAIAGRITDESQIVEVQLDGRPVPMEADGTIVLNRAVRPGSTTFTILAYDEWGNASQKSVTVTRAAAATPRVAAKPKAAPKPAAKVAADRAAPVIDLPGSLSTTGRSIELAGRISDASTIVEVTVEGRPVALGADGSVAVKRAVSIGSNTIRIAAIDEWGNKSEKKILVERQRPFADINFGTYHAIVIGNNDYSNMPKLKSAVNDAQAVADTLKSDYGFTVDLLINATRSDIIGALAKARGKLKANDNLLVYYAGHGVLDSYAEEGFWLPVDAEQENPANWVSNGDITNMLRAIRAKHVMVIADSCYSGTLVRAVNAKINTAKERKAWLKKMVKKRTRTALVSGGLEPVIDSGGGGHSVFAKAFLDALRANEDVLEGERLFSKIKRPVALESEQTPQYSDVRRAGHDGGDFMFVRR